ncbi:hypothetical protein EDB86DRAFT_1441140 [Lactarius hatsudake]|nr:hypothetical protein EDB86DRAFT_1441140 [Lactarius hatsudake]
MPLRRRRWWCPPGTAHAGLRLAQGLACFGNASCNPHLPQASNPFPNLNRPWSASAKDDRSDLKADLRPGHCFQPVSLVPTDFKSKSTYTGAELSSPLNEDPNGSSEEMPIAPRFYSQIEDSSFKHFAYSVRFTVAGLTRGAAKSDTADIGISPVRPVVPVMSSPLEPHWAVDFSAIREPCRGCANSGKRPPCGSLGHIREVFCTS